MADVSQRRPKGRLVQQPRRRLAEPPSDSPPEPWHLPSSYPDPGFVTTTATVVVPAATVIGLVLRNSVEDTSVEGTVAPPTCSCDVLINPVPITSSE